LPDIESFFTLIAIIRYALKQEKRWNFDICNVNVAYFKTVCPYLRA